MSNFSAFKIPGERPGKPVGFETQSQDPTTAVPVPSIAAVNAPAINPPMDWGGHRLVRTTNHGDLTHKTPPRSGSASPVGGAAAKAAAPEPNKSGSGSAVGGAAAGAAGSVSPVRLGQPLTQDPYSDDSMVMDSASGSVSPVQLGQPSTKNQYSNDSMVMDSASGSPQMDERDTAKVLEDVRAKLEQMVKKKASTARLLDYEKALLNAIMGNTHWPVENFMQMPFEEQLQYMSREQLQQLGLEGWKALDKAAALEKDLHAAKQTISELQRAAGGAGPQLVSPAAGGAGPQLVSPAAGGAGPQLVSPAAGGAGYSPVSPAGGAVLPFSHIHRSIERCVELQEELCAAQNRIRELEGIQEELCAAQNRISELEGMLLALL